MKINRAYAARVFEENLSEDFLIKHCLAVEIGMRAYAKKFGQDIEYWGAVGLLHDIDYEKYPDQHPLRAGEFLEKYGFDDYFIDTVISHGYEWEKERDLLQNTLVAVDSIVSFILSCAKKSPERTMDSLTADEVFDRLEDESFAPYADRKRICEFPKYIEMGLKEHIAFLIGALREALPLPQYALLEQQKKQSEYK